MSVPFDDGNEKWKEYGRSEAAAVRPASRPLERIALVDVEDPGRGVERPVGTTGEEGTAFGTRERGPALCEERTRELRGRPADVRGLAVVPPADGFEAAGGAYRLSGAGGARAGVRAARGRRSPGDGVRRHGDDATAGPPGRALPP
ncbi:hypothetical protein [Streptomyces caelestis]|uniref:hypothetical protein n=1 Tax=Streptomyces caelestis TaxID=36816 RepID=UPI003659A059